MRKNSIKHSRTNQEIQRALSSIIREEVHDPRVGIMTSVTRVNVATDLKTCEVYISVLGDENTKEETVAALKKASGFLRSRLASKMDMRNTPELKIIPDDSIEYGVRMSGVIDKVIDEMPVRDEENDAEE